MPNIVTIDTTRTNARSMSIDEVMVYIDLMDQVDGIKDQAIEVDDSGSDSYETTYSRGEKVRNAIKKFKVTDRKVEVRSHKQVDGTFIATIAYKN